MGNADQNNRSSTLLYYDGTAPANIAAVSDGTGADIAYTASASQLSASWTASSDAQSGIARYWYAIGTAPGGTTVTGWRDNGLNTSTTSAGLSLTNGQVYYFTVKAENGAGLLSEAANSNGQTVDTTSPQEEVKILQGVFDPSKNEKTYVTTKLTRSGKVKIKIYDQLGRFVATLFEGDRLPGAYSDAWEGKNKDNAKVSSGIYLIRIETPGYTVTKRVVLVK